MINLLSDVKKNEIRAARTNTILVRYILVLALAGLFIGGIVYISYESLKSSEKSATDQLTLGGTNASQGQANDEALLSALMSTGTQQDVKTSQLLARLAQVLPQGSFIRSFDLKTQNPQEKSLDLIVYAKKEITPESVRSSIETTGTLSQVTIRSSSTTAKDVPNHPVRIEFSTRINSAMQQPTRQGGPLL